MLHKYDKYNDLTEKQMPTLPEAGTLVEFKWLETINDPIANKGERIVGWPMHEQIPAFSKFKDEKGQWHDIGLIDRVDEDGSKKTYVPMYALLHHSPQKSLGELKINVGDPGTDALCQYLMLANFVKGSPANPNATGPFLLEYIDREADARRMREANARRREAEGIAFGLENAQVKEMAYLLGLDAALTDERLRAQIESYANKNPDGFLARIKDETAQYKARFAQAIALDILKFRPDTQFIVWNDASQKELFKVVRSDAEGMQAEYAEFILNTAGAVRYDQVIQDEIRKKIGGDPVKNKPGRKPAEV